MVLVHLGLLLLLYPQIADWFAQGNQSAVGSDYSHTVAGLPEQLRSDALRSAREYNEHLGYGGGYDPFTMSVDDIESEAYREYLEQLGGSPSDVMARIRIPEAGIDLPVLHGTTDAVLLHGVGHLFGTALPVGGPSTHSVLTGHSGLANAALFTDLHKLDAGDQFYIDVYGETLAYQVTSTESVLPTETDSLALEQGKDLVTLVTCTPVGINSHRLLVHAERLSPAPPAADPAKSPELPGFPWWAAIVGATTLASGTYIALGVKARRRELAEALVPDAQETLA
ncbi:class C sortase [Leucobacter sp. USCH14]|uniref:class C sortase n=1 Tax=Leucobacter sp. USCH14 TaxID=3024838 RepID=UPI0030A6263C